jgi:hypothetical protein
MLFFNELSQGKYFFYDGFECLKEKKAKSIYSFFSLISYKTSLVKVNRKVILNFLCTFKYRISNVEQFEYLTRT